MDNLGLQEMNMGSPESWGEDDPENDLWHFIALQTLSTTYGLCYLTVWRSHFPSRIEMWLWRASCLFQFAFFLAGLTAKLVSQAVHNVQLRRHSRHGVAEGAVSRISCLWAFMQQLLIGKHAAKFVKVSLNMFVGIASVITVLARLNLFAESWINLRDPPRGTYSTVRWTAYIPHIS